MKCVFLTNQASYHQMHFARAMVKKLGVDKFRIVFHRGTSDSRAEMGWSDDYSEPYILRFSKSNEERQEALEWIDKADVVIQGRFPIQYVRDRINRGKLTFACQERLWKKPASWLRRLSRFPHLYKNYYSVNKPNYHFFAIGTYAATDLNSLGLFNGRSWRYGYFIDCPELRPKPKSDHLRLLWCARFSPVKQPHKAIEVLQQLHHAGIPAKLTMIGDGELRPRIITELTAQNMHEHVKLTGWQSQSEVFAQMQESDLFLMTSHQGEGWGLVVNEALSHGCPVFANHQLGSAQWLIKSGVNGVLYHDGSIKRGVKKLIKLGVEGIRHMGPTAHALMHAHWSAEQAAERTIELAQALLIDDDDYAETMFHSGVCSAI